jgi:hypothetical protein
MVARSLLIGNEGAILDVLYADSDTDIDCSDDESEQETVINDNIQVENVSANGESEESSESEDAAAETPDSTRVYACVDINFCESECSYHH